MYFACAPGDDSCMRFPRIEARAASKPRPWKRPEQCSSPDIEGAPVSEAGSDSADEAGSINEVKEMQR